MSTTESASLNESTLDAFFAIAKASIEKHLSLLLTSQHNRHPHPLFDAARYALFSSGKRLRPLLTLATVKTWNIDISLVLQPACAVELVHTYSLIHDDLPCMDNDDLRRGLPSLHRVFPTGQALLTGDYLLTYAFELLATSPGLTSEQKLAMITSLAKSGGVDGMVGGQSLDLQIQTGKLHHLPLSDMLYAVHLQKSAELLAASIDIGAIAAQATQQERSTLRAFALDIGVAFQLVDDLLDTQEHDNTHTLNAVALIGRETTNTKIDYHFEQALHHLQTLCRPTPLLCTLAQQLIDRSH